LLDKNVKKVSVLPPVAASELRGALEAVFSAKVDALVIDDEVHAITNKLIETYVLKHTDKTFHVVVGSHPVNPTVVSSGHFNPIEANIRLEKLWNIKPKFGLECNAENQYLEGIVNDRYCLLNGLQVLRDDVQLASGQSSATHPSMDASGVDYSIPTVITTLAMTNCGDRIQGESIPTYHRVVASRFGTLAESGALKVESFTPAGGGTDDGNTLAHVTVAHQLDGTIRKHLYGGNDRSFVAVSLDMMSHVGRLDTSTKIFYGKTKESPWREDRAACGAVIGTLSKFNKNNTVHRRIRSNLGEENFAFLTQHGIKLADGTDITFVVAAAIVVIQGVNDTCQALAQVELDERGLAHVTGTLVINVMQRPDPVIYLTRATVFQKKIRIQGLGLDAKKYGGRIKDGNLILTYDGIEGEFFKNADVSLVEMGAVASDHGAHS